MRNFGFNIISSSFISNNKRPKARIALFPLFCNKWTTSRKGQQETWKFIWAYLALGVFFILEIEHLRQILERFPVSIFHRLYFCSLESLLKTIVAWHEIRTIKAYFTLPLTSTSCFLGLPIFVSQRHSRVLFWWRCIKRSIKKIKKTFDLNWGKFLQTLLWNENCEQWSRRLKSKRDHVCPWRSLSFQNQCQTTLLFWAQKKSDITDFFKKIVNKRTV